MLLSDGMKEYNIFGARSCQPYKLGRYVVMGPGVIVGMRYYGFRCRLVRWLVFDKISLFHMTLQLSY